MALHSTSTYICLPGFSVQVVRLYKERLQAAEERIEQERQAREQGGLCGEHSSTKCLSLTSVADFPRPLSSPPPHHAQAMATSLASLESRCLTADRRCRQLSLELQV